MLPMSQLAVGFLLPAALAAMVMLCAWRRPAADPQPQSGIGGLAPAT